MNRWGIIYCPKVGQRHSHKHWERIREYLEERGVEYDFVQSESTDSVERLAAMLATNGYTRIVVVGGDSALNRALNGILASGAKDTELAVIPYGFINDFAHYWGYSEDDVRRSVDWIIGGRTRAVDVGCLSYASDDPAQGQGRTMRYFLNCVNVGLASDLMSIQRTSRRWGVLRHFDRSLRILFRRKQHHVRIRIGHTDIDRSVMNVCIGNCHSYGQTPNAVPYSGLLDVCVLRAPGLKQLGQGMWLLAAGRFLNYHGAEMHRTRTQIQVADTGGARVSIDGLMLHGYDGRPFTVSLLPEHIRFVIPPANY